jgi:uncharacterized protein (DUF1778 family)
MSTRSEYLTIRVDAELKDEISKAAQLEHRSLSNMSKLLLEFAWDRYLAAGSIRELLENPNGKVGLQIIK